MAPVVGEIMSDCYGRLRSGLRCRLVQLLSSLELESLAVVGVDDLPLAINLGQDSGGLHEHVQLPNAEPEHRPGGRATATDVHLLDIPQLDLSSKGSKVHNAKLGTLRFNSREAWHGNLRNESRRVKNEQK
jgi:hypothetical protein